MCFTPRNTLVTTLPKLAEEASDEELALGFEEHLEETRQHVKNISRPSSTSAKSRARRSALASRE